MSCRHHLPCPSACCLRLLLQPEFTDQVLNFSLFRTTCLAHHPIRTPDRADHGHSEPVAARKEPRLIPQSAGVMTTNPQNYGPVVHDTNLPVGNRILREPPHLSQRETSDVVVHERRGVLCRRQRRRRWRWRRGIERRHRRRRLWPRSRCRLRRRGRRRPRCRRSLRLIRDRLKLIGRLWSRQRPQRIARPSIAPERRVEPVGFLPGSFCL